MITASDLPSARHWQNQNNNAQNIFKHFERYLFFKIHKTCHKNLLIKTTNT